MALDSKQNKQPALISERILRQFLPEHFLQGEDAFRAKVLWLYSTVLGALGLIVLLIMSLAEGDVPARRLVTVIFAALLFGVTILMRYAKQLKMVSVYVCCISTSLVFYVDFNNSSIQGPTTLLWVIPFLLMALLFSGVHLILFMMFTFSLFLFNAFALYQGWLPEPIIDGGLWDQMQIIYLLCVAILIVLCTRGMSNLADNHLNELSQELKNKQIHIEQINLLKVQAEASMQSKSKFLATMSHELRTPLNSVIGNAQLLARAQLPSKHNDKVNDIALAGNLLLMLINDILDFSKLEEDELTFIEQPYNITQQITDICRMMKPKLKQGVVLEFSASDIPIYIQADKNRLSQVLMNLLSNAMKFTDHGYIRVTLSEYGDNGVKISIADSGIGIKAENLSHLFTEFSQFTDDSARNMEGTGLGLAISKGLMQKMGGTIEVTSEFKKGSCFTLILPDKRISTPNVIVDKVNSPVVGELSLHDLSILVVDDIAMNCTVLEAMLEDFSANCLTSVTSGQQAIEYIAKNLETKLILMDMRMPEMSGVDATKKIRQLGYQGLVIAVTANVSEQDKQECINAGMNDFIAKPVTMLELERVLLKTLKS